MKCDNCGKFVSYKDIEKGYALSQLLTPDSEFTAETYETLCRKCNDIKRAGSGSTKFLENWASGHGNIEGGK